MTPHVLVVAHDATGNSLGRAAVVADLLEPACSVAIAAFGPTAWEPLAGDDRITLLPLPRSNLGVPGAIRRLGRVARGASALVAVKPRALSYGAAAVVRGGRRLLLDIDDFEPAFVKRRLGAVRQMVSPDHLPITRFLERWRPQHVEVSVASRALQQRYGGMWLPHIRDRDRLAPDVHRLRSGRRAALKLGPEDLVIGFVGTVRAHKGVAELASAVGRVAAATLAIVETRMPENELNELRRRAGGRLLVMPRPRMEDLASALAVADVVVVPQSPSVSARFQSPAKLLDGMAAGLPVIAGDIGDARELLGETGLFVPPGDIEALAQAIGVLADRDRRTLLGVAARQRYEDRFRLPKWRDRVRQKLLPRLGINA